jgi:cysteine synthase
MTRTPPDWTKTGTVSGYADYLRKQSDAICVLVIRPHDSVFSVDLKCPPAEAERLVTEYVPRLAERVEAARKEKKAAMLERIGDGDLSPME